MDEKDWKCINCREEEVIKQCKECKLNIVGNNAFARCKKCDAIVHKQPKCSGTTRDRMNIMKKTNTDWICKECRNPTAYNKKKDANNVNLPKTNCYII